VPATFSLALGMGLSVTKPKYESGYIKCIISANGGVPPSQSSVHQTTPSPQPTSGRAGGYVPGGRAGVATRGPVFPNINPTSSKMPICEQGVPEGRFCGFALKFAFNKETGSCDQFWFPGCRTEDTNGNLFDTLADCRSATGHCRGGSKIL